MKKPHLGWETKKIKVKKISAERNSYISDENLRKSKFFFSWRTKENLR